MKSIIIYITLIIIGFIGYTNAMVIGIDLGAQSFKIGLIKPGAFETVLNEQSGRKTLSQVGWFREERVFASDAFNLWARNPNQVYSMFTPLLGKSYKENKLEEIGLGVLGYQVQNDTLRNTFAVIYDGETVYSPEELTAMIFRKIKDLTFAYTRSNIRDCVIAVPVYLDQYQRQAVLDAASIAGLNVLSLINDVSAASISFSIDRTFDKNQTAIFYDMGAKSTKLSLIQLSSSIELKNKKNKTTTNNIIKSMEWDENLGGIDFDMVIVNYLKELIKKQFPGTDIQDKKLTIKLIKEASKMKETLSANQQAQIFIGSLIDDNDFSATITRKQFEELSTPLFERAILPLKRLIELNNLKPNEIDLIELIGGCTRIPGVQQALKDYLKKEVLDKHLNGDEAICSGAAFYAASMTHYFRVKDIRLKDITPYSIDVKIQQQSSGGDNVETLSTILDESSTNLNNQTLLFKQNNRINVKKTLTFSTNSSFSLELTNGGNGLVTYNITSIPQPNVTSLNFTGKPKIHCSFKLNSNGMVLLERVEAEVSITYQKVKNNNNNNKKDIKKQEKKSTPPVDPQEEIEIDDEKVEEVVEEKEEEPLLMLQHEMEWVTKVQRIPLNFTTTYQHVLPLSKDEIQSSILKLDQLDEKDKTRKDLLQEKNNLESFIYDHRDKLDSEEFISCSTSDQRIDLNQELDKSSNWLYDNENNLNIKDYQDQFKSIKDKFKQIILRVTTKQQLPSSFELLEQSIQKSKSMLPTIIRDLNVTIEEIKFTNDLIDSTIKWLKEKKEAFSLADFKNDIPVSTNLINIKIYDLEQKLKELSKKKKKTIPKKPKVETKSKDEEIEQDPKVEKQEEKESNVEQQEEPKVVIEEQQPKEQVEQQQEEKEPKVVNEQQPNNDKKVIEEEIKPSPKPHIHDEL